MLGYSIDAAASASDEALTAAEGSQGRETLGGSPVFHDDPEKEMTERQGRCARNQQYNTSHEHVFNDRHLSSVLILHIIDRRYQSFSALL